ERFSALLRDSAVGSEEPRRRGGRGVLRREPSRKNQAWLERARAGSIFAGSLLAARGRPARAASPNGASTVQYSANKSTCAKPAAGRTPRRFHAPMKRDERAELRPSSTSLPRPSFVQRSRKRSV